MHSRRTMHADHRRHDRLLIARFAAADSYPTEIEEARTQIAACSDCAALAEDIRALSRAVAKVSTPARTRDFRLTVEQADKLRGSWFERLMRRFAGPGLGTLRPVAGVALSIGLVMAVAGALPSFAPAGPASDAELGFPGPSAAQEVDAPESSPFAGDGVSAPVDQSAAAPMASRAPAEYASPVAAAATDAPGGKDSALEAEGTLEPITRDFDNIHNASPGADIGRQAGTDLDANSTNTSRILTYGGLLLALGSLALLIGAWFARRRFSDRLLR